MPDSIPERLRNGDRVLPVDLFDSDRIYTIYLLGSRISSIRTI
jgi:hypothetical protein